MILVTGATGLNGSELVRRLSARGVHVRALVRNSARATGLASLPMVEIVEGDMAYPETLTVPLRGVERAMLISSSDPAMLEVQSNFIEEARKAALSTSLNFPELCQNSILPFDTPACMVRLSAGLRPQVWLSRTCVPASSCTHIFGRYRRSSPGKRSSCLWRMRRLHRSTSATSPRSLLPS